MIDIQPDLTFDFYINSFPKLQGGRVKKTLLSTRGFNGKYWILKDWCFKIFQDPEIRIDDNKKRIYLSKELNFFEFKDTTKIAIDYIRFLRSKNVL